MPATLLDGKSLANRVLADVRTDAIALRAAGFPPKLAAILVGDISAGHIYAQNQQKRSHEYGIDYELIFFDADRLAFHEKRGDLELALLREIRRLNADLSITGIMLHLPLPESVRPHRLQYEIDPFKDVEGVNPANVGLIFYDVPLMLPCTAKAAVELVHASGVTLRGAEAVVVGQSGIVGRPTVALLTRDGATVTGCHIDTRDLAFHTKRADVLVVAVGKAGLVDGSMVKPGAIVIDVGINRLEVDGETKIVGDCTDDVAEAAGYLTPVPGGVGPMTVAMLMRNTIDAVKKQRERAGR